MKKTINKKADKLNAVLPPIRCTEDEKLSIKKKAKDAHLSLSAYIRKVALSGQVIRVQNDLTYDAIDQLRRIGINLNQQTRRLNATGNMPLQLQYVWERLELALDQLLEGK